MNNFKAPHVSKSIVKQVLAGSAVAVALLVAGGNAVNADTTSANVTNPTPTTQTPTTQTTDNQASQAKAATITVNFKDGDKVVKTIKVDVKDVNNADDLNQANDSIKSQLPDNYKLADGVAVNTNATDTNMDVAVTSTTPAETDTNKATDNDKQKGSIHHLTPAEMQAAKESAKKAGVTVNEDGVAYDGNTDGMPNPYAPKTDITTGTPVKTDATAPKQSADSKTSAKTTSKTDTSKVADNDKQKGSIYHLTPVEMQVAKEADKKDATAPKQSTESKTSAKTTSKTDTNKATDNDKQKGSIHHLTPAEMQAAKESAKKAGVTVNEDGVAYDGNTDGMPNPYAPKTDITTGTPVKTDATAPKQSADSKTSAKTTSKTDTSKVADNDKQKGSIYHLTPVEMQVAKEADKKDATAPKQSTESKTSAKTTSKTDTNKATDNDKQKGSIYHLTPAEMQAAKESAKKDGVTVNEDGVAYDGNVDGMPNPYAPKTDITTGTPAKGANVTPDGQILTQVDPLAPISGDDSSNIPSSIDLSATKDMPWNDTMSALDNPNGNPYNTDLNANSDTTGNQTNSALPDTGQNTKNSGVIAAIGAGLVAIAGLFGLARSRKTVK